MGISSFRELGRSAGITNGLVSSRKNDGQLATGCGRTNRQARGGSKEDAVDAPSGKDLVDGGVSLNRPAILLERDRLHTTAICTKPSQADLRAAVEQVAWADD